MPGTPLHPSRRAGSRAAIALELQLERQRGRAIAARTVNVGSGGMCVRTARPLAVDEVLHFDLDLTPLAAGRRCDGEARVLREQRPNEYALRIERLGDAGALDDLLARLVGAPGGLDRPAARSTADQM